MQYCISLCQLEGVLYLQEIRQYVVTIASIQLSFTPCIIEDEYYGEKEAEMNGSRNESCICLDATHCSCFTTLVFVPRVVDSFDLYDSIHIGNVVGIMK